MNFDELNCGYEQENGRFIVSLSIINFGKEEMPFYVEPWGDKYIVPPNDTFYLVVEGPAPGFPGVATEKGKLVYYGWNGSAFEVYHQDKLLSLTLDQCLRC